MTDSSIETLGLDLRWARPEWLLITALPVAPPHVRPSVTMDGTGRSDDDLTHQLATIVKVSGLRACGSRVLRLRLVGGFALVVLNVMSTRALGKVSDCWLALLI